MCFGHMIILSFQAKSGGRLIVAGFSMKRRAEKQKDTDSSEPIKTESEGGKAEAPVNEPTLSTRTHREDTKPMTADKPPQVKPEPGHPNVSSESVVDKTVASDPPVPKVEIPKAEVVDPMDQDTDTSSRSEAMDDEEEAGRGIETTTILTAVARVNLGKKQDLVTEAFTRNRHKPSITNESGVKPRPRATKTQSTSRKSSQVYTIFMKTCQSCTLLNNRQHLLCDGCGNMANHGPLFVSKSSTNNQDGDGLVSDRGTEEWVPVPVKNYSECKLCTTHSLSQLYIDVML